MCVLCMCNFSKVEDTCVHVKKGRTCTCVFVSIRRCLHFRGCYVQSAMELGPEDVSLLERYPH